MSYYNYHRDGLPAPAADVFVFGSNLAGVHGAGAAKAAFAQYGAKWGVGEGLVGRAYAIPTKDINISSMSLIEIDAAVKRFVEFAWANDKTDFFMTRIGCGLAGYLDEHIAPMFIDAPRNINFPVSWSDYIEPDTGALTGLERFRPTMTEDIVKAWAEDADQVIQRLCVDLYETRLLLARKTK